MSWTRGSVGRYGDSALCDHWSGTKSLANVRPEVIVVVYSTVEVVLVTRSLKLLTGKLQAHDNLNTGS